MTLIRFAFNRGILPPCRAWFLEGALSHSARMGIPPPSASSDRYSYRLGVGPHSVQVCCGWRLRRAPFGSLSAPNSRIMLFKTSYSNGWVAAWPLQSPDIGVCCRDGTEIAHHTISALLDTHPTFIDVSLAAKNAFNSLARESFIYP